MKPCGRNNVISPDTDAMQALNLMQQTGNGRLLVVENGKLEGILTLKDLMKFISVKLDLEGQQNIDVNRV